MSVDRVKWASTRQLAEILNVKKSTIRSWASRGLIPVLRPTATTARYCVDSVMAALQKISDERTGAAGSEEAGA